MLKILSNFIIGSKFAFIRDSNDQFFGFGENDCAQFGTSETVFIILIFYFSYFN
jgi:hypothetical protein